MRAIKTYRTAEIAELIGVHPNTVRLYEKLELIPRPERKANGYRVFTEFHLEQFRLARTAFQIEVLQNGLRSKIVEVVKTSAKGDFDRALSLAEEYLCGVRRERDNAEESIRLVQQILSGDQEENIHCLRRKEVSDFLSISMDTLRNWELNGLLTVKRKQNGYRIYVDEDIRQLKIIRTLRCANYSLESILRMLRQLSVDPGADIKAALNTPMPDDDIISVCDKLIHSLSAAECNALDIMEKLRERIKSPACRTLEPERGCFSNHLP